MSSKYIVENGKVKLNPSYGGADKHTTVANPEKALVWSTTIDDANTLTDVTGQSLAPSTLATVVNVQEANYAQQFGCTFNDGELLEAVSRVFQQMEAPIGLSAKLIRLQGYIINMKLDDSGSMTTMCNNGYTRWWNLHQRLMDLMTLLSVVPTRQVQLSFLNRRELYTINRQGVTPDQFLQQARSVLDQAFRAAPQGNTPIYQSVVDMLRNRNGLTAHYLFTDGVPSTNGYTKEDEIRYTQDVLLNRANPAQTPFTIGCCSDNPTDTMWIHEIEEEACRPGRSGYVAALQNFEAEQIEVLNDQGPVFPYSRAIWLLCNLVAAMNPNDLDALDQHAPLSKPTLDSILGHITTASEYEAYFSQHPNAMWLFAEDYEQLVTAEIAIDVAAVRAFDTWLANQLNLDINNGDDTSEFRAIAKVEQSVLARYSRQRPQDLFNHRMNFWNNHCLSMELRQMQFYTTGRGGKPGQDLFSDYLVNHGKVQEWKQFISQKMASRSAPPSYNESVFQPARPMYPSTYTDASMIREAKQGVVTVDSGCCCVL